MSTNTSAGLPADGVVELTFNRLLLPSAVTRQTISLRTAGNTLVDPPPIVIYDPVLLKVRIQNPNTAGGTWLTPGQPYKIVVGLPAPDSSETFVLRAIDGAQFDPNARNEIAFMATNPTFQKRKPDIEFCRDVSTTFSKYCSSGCHQATSRPYEALLLDTADGIIHTALGHVSQEANTGARAGTPGAPGRVFGIDMPIIDPGNPGNSWLIYKMMLLTEGAHAPYQCYKFDPPNVLLPDGGAWLPPDERGRLANLMTGQMMPPINPFPTVDDVERVSEWIAQGAHLDVCLGCVEAPDSGPDTGVMDSGSDAGSDAPNDSPVDSPTDAPDGD